MATGRTAGVLLVAALIGLVPPFYYTYRSTATRGFRVVEDGKLYRSGEMPLPQLGRILSEYRIKTVVNFREPRDPSRPDRSIDEEKMCVDRGVAYVRIPKHRWTGSAADEAAIDLFLKTIDDAENQPILAHCFAGIHRTGAHCALYRIEKNGWTPDEAMAEMRAFGYKALDSEDDMYGFLSAYKPRLGPGGEGGR